VVTPPAPTAAPEAPAEAPPAPATFTVSGTASGMPAGVTAVSVTISGPGGTFGAVTDGAGNFSIGGVPAGTYSGTYSWESTDGTATRAGRIDPFAVAGDTSVSFSVA
jgi:hypothetical protein